MSSSSSGPEGRAKDAAVEVAEKVASLIRKHNAMELFRARVRECAAERLAAQEERRHRAQQRREEAGRNGVWLRPGKRGGEEDKERRPCRGGVCYGDEELPRRPDRGYVSWVETFRGFVETVVRSYSEYDVHVWLPPELHPSLDPDQVGPLPVPNRVVTMAEKLAALAAVHDADPLGNEKIDAWATAEAAAKGPPLWRRQPCPEGNWYFLLIHDARQMGDCEVAAVKGWLEEIEWQVKGDPEGLPDPTTLEQGANLLCYEVKTLYMEKSFPPPRVPASGRRPALYSCRDARAWALENRPKRAYGMPEDYEDAKRRFLGPPQVSSQEVKAR